MIGGCAVVRDDDLGERLQFIHNAAGAVAGPFDAWLALRGTKTLHLRMRQHDANGREIAKWLVEQVGPRERVLHRAAVASAARAGPAPDVRVRRNDQRRARDEGARGPRARAGARLRARRVARRRRVADQPAGRDDARVGAAGAARRHGSDATGWSGFRAGWRTSATCSPTWSRPSREFRSGRGSGKRGGGRKLAATQSAAAHRRVSRRSPRPRVPRPSSRLRHGQLASRSSRSRRARGNIPPIAPRSTRSAPFPGSTRSCAKVAGFFGERGIRQLFLGDAVQGDGEPASATERRCGPRCSRRSTGPSDRSSTSRRRRSPTRWPSASTSRSSSSTPGCSRFSSEDELRTVLGHELGHIMSGHTDVQHDRRTSCCTSG